MTQSQLQVLLELDEGEFHAHQSERSRAGRAYRHSQMAGALGDLLRAGLVERVGTEFWVSEAGRDALRAAAGVLGSV